MVKMPDMHPQLYTVEIKKDNLTGWPDMCAISTCMLLASAISEPETGLSGHAGVYMSLPWLRD